MLEDYNKEWYKTTVKTLTDSKKVYSTAAIEFIASDVHSGFTPSWVKKICKKELIKRKTKLGKLFYP